MYNDFPIPPRARPGTFVKVFAALIANGVFFTPSANPILTIIATDGSITAYPMAQTIGDSHKNYFAEIPTGTGPPGLIFGYIDFQDSLGNNCGSRKQPLCEVLAS